jgi:hypothetical protein
MANREKIMTDTTVQAGHDLAAGADATTLGREVHVRPGFQIHNGGGTAARPRRKRPPNGPVTVTGPDSPPDGADPAAWRLLWEAAFSQAGGDPRRLVTVSATEIAVINEPGGCLPEMSGGQDDERPEALAEAIERLTGCMPGVAVEWADRVWTGTESARKRGQR